MSLTVAFLLLAISVAATNIVQAAPTERRAVNKLVKDFPEKPDLSTPESAMAASCRRCAQGGLVAALEVSWIQVDAATAKDIEVSLKVDPQGPKLDLRQVFRNAEIIEVLVYRDDLAAVVFKDSRGGATPYGGVPFGRINGVWKSLTMGLPGDHTRRGDSSSATTKEIADAFESYKEDAWQEFVKLRNEVLNGRTPSVGKSGRPASGAASGKAKSKPPERSDAEKAEMEQAMRRAGRVVIRLDVPDLERDAVQFALLDEDPVPDIAEQFKQVQLYHRRQLSKAADEADRERHRNSQMLVCWDLGFRKITADRLGLLSRRAGSEAGPSENVMLPPAKKWLVTKTVSVGGKPMCWCIPIDVKVGETIDIVLRRSNAFNLRAVYDKAMQGAPSAVNASTWQVTFELDAPSVSPQAVQYAIFDEDPVPAFAAQLRRMASYNRKQLEKDDTLLDKKRMQEIQMGVAWDVGFKGITGDKVYLINNASRSSMMSNGADGKKWFVTKIAHAAQGRPVCWCIPVEVRRGELTEVSFNEKNTFNLRTVYNDVMNEATDKDKK